MEQIQLGIGSTKTGMYECVCVHLLSRVQLFVTPWTVACQGSLSMEFSRQEYWSRLPFSSPGDLPYPGSNLRLLHWQRSLPAEPPGKPSDPEALCE